VPAPRWCGNVVKVYRDHVDVDLIVKDASAIDRSPTERLDRAVPFRGTFYFGLPLRNYLPYGRELLDNGLDGAAVTAFERAVEAKPSAPTLYRLGTLLAKSGERVRAREAFERALVAQPDLAEANNDLGALLAQEGDLDSAISRFRAALASIPDYPDALNNLGYALLLTGRDQEARTLYERALALQPDFPEALNNLGLLFGRAGDMTRAERYFRDALGRRPDYGEAANNLALVLVSKGQVDAAVDLLQGVLSRISKVRGSLPDTGKDPPQRRPHERGDRGARAAPAGQSESCRCSGTAPAVERALIEMNRSCRDARWRYSARSVSAGLTTTARRSGDRLARIAVTPTAPITNAIVSGSAGSTPNRMPDISEPNPRPAAVPIASPMPASRTTRLRTKAPTCLRWAPRAKRMPNSRVRCATA
jgi:Flp pilus assembly protein TadD